jgi:hypothetical protein
MKNINNPFKSSETLKEKLGANLAQMTFFKDWLNKNEEISYFGSSYFTR